MSVVELYGKCRELGYCDCGGFLGCVDDIVRPRPKDEVLESARAARGGNPRIAEIVAEADERPCGYCAKRGNPCVRHGGTSGIKQKKVRPAGTQTTGRGFELCVRHGKALNNRHAPLCESQGITRLPAAPWAEEVVEKETIPIPRLTEPKPRPTMPLMQSDDIEPQTIEIPNHEVIIKLAGVEIIIRPIGGNR